MCGTGFRCNPAVWAGDPPPLCFNVPNYTIFGILSQNFKVDFSDPYMEGFGGPWPPLYGGPKFYVKSLLCKVK